ncbi:phage tail protein [Flavobacterium frigoris]|uniref:Microcystin-dependent protein n=1 Tax=Flavobacterium frigoris TaxID=229204 RepID=A0A1H9NUE6_FLAFI|nr:tail fiber protein [Flavobacterium frigoris]SER39590.1 Microcystin-dependent protein [Flavobacterium frigoris]
MEQVIGQIQAFAFNFPPRDWAFCDGQILAISTNTALFSLIGTTFGGNGTSTFALPDLRGRTIVHPGSGPGVNTIDYGEKGGSENTTLTIFNMPSHNHLLVNGTAAGQVNVTTNTVVNTSNNGGSNESDSGNNSLGSGSAYPNTYSEPPIGTTDKIGGVTSSSTINGSTALAGSNIPFSNRSPYLGIYTSIALNGIFPSRN